jgi:hypothetical protein
MNGSKKLYLSLPQGPGGPGWLCESLSKNGPGVKLTPALASVVFVLAKVRKGHRSLPAPSVGWIDCADLCKRLEALHAKSCHKSPGAVRKNVEHLEKRFGSLNGQSRLTEYSVGLGRRVTVDIVVINGKSKAAAA